MSREIVEVYADWQPIETPLLIDPILTLHSGELYNDEANKNFRAFLDSSPDRWGRILMQRRAAIEARKGIQASLELVETTPFG